MLFHSLSKYQKALLQDMRVSLVSLINSGIKLLKAHLGKKPKMLWQHEAKEPIGLWTTLYEDERGLYVEGRLALGVSRADEAYLLLKKGILDGLSIGFRTVESIYDQKQKTRLLLDLDLLEISLVTFGANSKATVQSVKTV